MDVGRDIEREKASITNGRCFYDGDLKVEDERKMHELEEFFNDCILNSKTIVDGEK